MTAILVVMTAILVLLGVRQRVRKDLGYRISATTLVSVHPDAHEDVTILVGGHRIATRVHLVRMELSNAGADIAEADFDRDPDSRTPIPIRLPLGESARVLGPPQVEETSPQHLDPRVETDGQSLIVRPLLLNRGDRLTVAAKVENLSGPLVPIARITGVSKLTKIQPERRRATTRRFAILLGLVIVLGTVATLAAAMFTALSGWELRPHRSDASVEFTDGRTVCGPVKLEGDLIEVKVNGEWSTFPLDSVRTINDALCSTPP